MGTSLRDWIVAARPRTVLLSLSGVLMGGFLAYAENPAVNLWTLVFCALTAVLLQILSNLANDYGDYKKGVDNAHRTGPERTLQSGVLTERQMRVGIAVVLVLCLLTGGLLLLSVILVHASLTTVIVFAALGLAAIAAALLYTLGKRPYGYRGLGDLFCFLFFGWVAVVGTFYLATQTIDFSVLLPATALGCCSNAVLNINNMRDYENDKASGKRILVVKKGLTWAFGYHVLLMVGPFLCLTVFLGLKHSPWFTYAFWLLFPLFLKDLLTIHKQKERGAPDRLLPRQVLHTLLLTLAFGLLLNHNLLGL